MVVGNGLIASALSEYNASQNVLVFASGVSNSLGVNQSDFDREKSLLLKYKNFNGRVIYFSTCSVFDKSLVDTKYVHHKIAMETLIKSNFNNYYILRLPTIVGRSKNPYIFFNNIKTKLNKSDKIIAFKHATRYLLGIDDVPLILSTLLELNMSSRSMNVAFDNKAKVTDIINLMRNLLNSNSEIIIEEKGADLKIDNREFIKIISEDKKKYCDKYEDIIRKYILV